MERATAFINSEMKKFVVSQKEKFGYTDDTEFYGLTLKELQENGAKIGCSTLYAIFENHFDSHDTHKFWFDLQIGLYDFKKPKNYEQ